MEYSLYVIMKFCTLFVNKDGSNKDSFSVLLPQNFKPKIHLKSWCAGL